MPSPGEGGKGALGSLMRALMPFMEAQPSWPNHLPKAHLLTITVGHQDLTCEFGAGEGYTNTQCIASSKRGWVK